MAATKKCPNCDRNIKQAPGKREKFFCNSSCRSAYWKRHNYRERKPTKAKETPDKKTGTSKNKKPASPKPFDDEKRGVSTPNINKKTGAPSTKKPAESPYLLKRRQLKS